MSDQRHRVQVDHSEREAPLLELLRRSGAFDVQIVRLTVGDYLINDEVLIEAHSFLGSDVAPHVLHTCDAGDSFRAMQFLATQASGRRERMLRRYDRKPKRLTSRRLFLLQGLPGVGPAIAARLLNQLGSIRSVVTSSAQIQD